MNKREKGNFGEDMAERFLTSQNYRIIARNFKAGRFEVDVIAEDLYKHQIVFVEVKLRKSTKFGLPEESVTNKKIDKISTVAMHFLSRKNCKYLSGWRIDIIAVKLNSEGKLEEIKQIKNIENG